MCSFVPVHAAGFEDLQQRIVAQTQLAVAHQERLKVQHVLLATCRLIPPLL